MELKKYRKSYWSKILLIIIITIGIIMYLYVRCHPFEKRSITSHVMISTAPRMISTNIEWRDSICMVVLDEIELTSIVDTERYRTKLSHEGFILLSDKDTLIVDSLSYMKLREYRVIPQHSIDSIYKSEGIKGLLSTYFDEEWFIPHCSNDSILALLEQRYIIYILQQHGFSAKIDCESGYLYITKE